MVQVAPYPVELEDLVHRCHYRSADGWYVDLIDDCPRDKDSEGKVIGHGLTLRVLTKGYDTYNPGLGNTYRVYHYFIVPAATFNRAAWARWLFEQCCKVEIHEAMENFLLLSDECPHCGQLPETDGDHSCTCLKPNDECMEHPAQKFDRPFAPLHGPGDDPYVVHEYATDLQKRTQFTGKINDE